jgi:hypothetical protein
MADGSLQYCTVALLFCAGKGCGKGHGYGHGNGNGNGNLKLGVGLVLYSTAVLEVGPS